MLTKTYTTETTDWIEYLKERNYHDEDMYNFIDEYGEENFRKYYEDYVTLGENYDYEAVDAFITEYYLEDLEYFEDSYCGCYQTFREFAEEHFDSFYGHLMPEGLQPYIDIERYSNDLEYDHTHVNGFIFRAF